MGRTLAACQHCPQRLVRTSPSSQALQVLFRGTVSGLPRPCDLRGRCRHGRQQGRRRGCVATSALRQGPRGFLGLPGYYRKFIWDYGIIAAPLTRLLRRDAFAWDDDATAALEAQGSVRGAQAHLDHDSCVRPDSCVRGAQAHLDHGTSSTDAGLRRHLRGRLQRVRRRVRCYPSPGRRTPRLLQSDVRCSSSQAGRL